MRASALAASLAIGLAPALPACTSGTDTRSGSIVSGGYRLEYAVEGRGQPAMVIGDPGFWQRHFPPQLKSRWRVAYIDHRVFAREHPAPAPGDFAVERIVDDIELLRTELRLPPAIVIGWSGNSYLALEYAKKYPQHVSHVVMIGIAPQISAATLAAGQQRFDAAATSERKAALLRNQQRWPDELIAAAPADQTALLQWRRNAPMTWFDPQADPGGLTQRMYSNEAGFSSLWLDQFARIDVTRGLDRLAAPVFLALGRHDYNFAEPPGYWDGVRNQFRDLTVQVFERSGHQPQIEEAEEFSRLLLEWVAEKSAPGG